MLPVVVVAGADDVVVVVVDTDDVFVVAGADDVAVETDAARRLMTDVYAGLVLRSLFHRQASP